MASLYICYVTKHNNPRINLPCFATFPINITTLPISQTAPDLSLTTRHKQKGAPCLYHPATQCQENYCSECNLYPRQVGRV